MHVLQRKAKATKLRKVKGPVGAAYNFAGGVWKDESGLITYDSRYETMSKKADVETGEDMKGQ